MVPTARASGRHPASASMAQARHRPGARTTLVGPSGPRAPAGRSERERPAGGEHADVDLRRQAGGLACEGARRLEQSGAGRSRAGRRGSTCPSGSARRPRGAQQRQRLGGRRGSMWPGPSAGPSPTPAAARRRSRREVGHARRRGRCRRRSRRARPPSITKPTGWATGRGGGGGRRARPDGADARRRRRATRLAGRQLEDVAEARAGQQRAGAPRRDDRAGAPSRRSDGRSRWSWCRWESSTASTCSQSAGAGGGAVAAQVDDAAAAAGR